MTKDEKIAAISGLMFRDEYGQPLHLSPTQQEIFSCIATKKYPRIGIITPTQYGKSLSTALGTIVRAVTFPEKFTIVAPTHAKTRIIMSYVIEHIFDNPYLLGQLKIEGGQLEVLRRERNRDHLSFKRGGAITVLTAESRNRKRLGESLLGHGAGNVIIDDSGLIEDNLYVFILRMVGGVKDNLIVETGNPVKRNHFFRTMTGKRFHKIWIDYKVALEEGRFTQEFVDEMKEQHFFDILYECKFPNEGQIDEHGWQDLVTWEQIQRAVDRPKLSGNHIQVGMDIGAGGCYNSVSFRDGNYLYIRYKDKERNTMTTADNIKELIETDKLRGVDFWLEKDGIGLGVYDRCCQLGLNIGSINEGEKADDPTQFSNKRAENHWKLKEFIEKDGKLANDPDLLEQIKNCRWRINTTGKIQIEPKENLSIRGSASPDFLDSCTVGFSGDKQYGYAVKINSEKIAQDIDSAPDMATTYQEFQDMMV